MDARCSGGEGSGTLAPFGNGELSLPDQSPLGRLVESVLVSEDAVLFERF